ncbi:major facilitator superfamily domain-containing protein 4A isoform X1 [Oryx dammah]|uniref:major facilitator superfamily domain-containing protein 4A isoform X1 n=1 Tax=Oryx dammah TaxID=59534 RepID=UPI001A9A796B|nr:major facilitator superfamily domain-containing protein 4A isoform X1 [Oryx dammah]
MGCDVRVSGLLRRNLQPTLTYWSVFFSFGMCIAFLGPTLLDLRCQTRSSLPEISWVLFSQQLCLLLGSALGGVFKRTLAQSLWALFTSSLAISLVFATIPFCRDVEVLASVMALAGLAMGCIDTVANMQLVRIYQKDSAVFLQVLHFFVGFGALLSPLIADPFLSEANCLPANSTANATSGSHLFHASRVLGRQHPEAQPWSNRTLPGMPSQDGAGTRVSYAFWIMALINLPVPLAVLYLLSKERLLGCCPQRRPLLLSADELTLETQPPEKEDASSLSPQFHPGHEDLFSCCQRKNFRGVPSSFFAIHITAALVLFMTDGLTGAYSAFVYSYAVEKPLSVGHKVAGYLPSLFWGFITLGRLVSIPVSSRVKPATMVFINVVSSPFHCLETQKNRSPRVTALPQDTFSAWTLPQVGGGRRGWNVDVQGREMLGWKPKACGPFAWSWKSPFLSLGLRLKKGAMGSDWCCVGSRSPLTACRMRREAVLTSILPGSPWCPGRGSERCGRQRQHLRDGAWESASCSSPRVARRMTFRELVSLEVWA